MSIHFPLSPDDFRHRGDRHFAEIAAERCGLSLHQVAQALRLQRELRRDGWERPLGEIVRDCGWLTPSQIREVLFIKHRHRPDRHWYQGHDPGLTPEDETALLARLLAQGWLTAGQGEQVRGWQRKYRHLGYSLRTSCLVQWQGWCTREQVLSVVKVVPRPCVQGEPWWVRGNPVLVAVLGGLLAVVAILTYLGIGRSSWDRIPTATAPGERIPGGGGERKGELLFPDAEGTGAENRARKTRRKEIPPGSGAGVRALFETIRRRGTTRERDGDLPRSPDGDHQP